MQKFYDLARVLSSTTGTSSLLLGNAVPGYLTFADAGAAHNDGVTYCIHDGAASEIGRGTLTYSGGLWYLSRDTVLQSTNADAKINCTGQQEVFVTFSAADILDLAALLAAGSTIGSWKRWRVRNITLPASAAYSHINKLRFKLGGTTYTPDSVAYSGNAVDPTALFAGTGDWHCLGEGWIEAIWTAAKSFDAIALEATATTYGAAVAAPPLGMEIWVSNDGDTYYPLHVIDLLAATIGTSGNIVTLPTTWPWGGSNASFGPTLPNGGATGEVLTKNSSTNGDASWAAIPGKALSQLTDSTILTPTDGQFLIYDATSGKWVNTTKNVVLGAPHSILGSGAHRYWRFLNMHAVGANVSFNEVRFYVTPGGTYFSPTSATASSHFDGSLVEANAIDGNLSTGWASTETGSSSTAWIAFDFGTAKEFEQLWMACRTDGFYNQAPDTFSLQYSDDNSTWVTLQTVNFSTWTTNGQQQSSLIYKSGYALALEDLFDVNPTMSPSNGDALVWDSTNSYWTKGTMHSVPSGGSSGQVLAKNSSTDYDLHWITPATGSVPNGGTTGQALTKNSSTDGDVGWSTISGGGGGGTTRLKDRFSPPATTLFTTLLGTNSVNPSIANKSDGSFVFDFGASPAGGDNNRMALKSISGSTWTVIARIDVSLFDYDYNGAGIYLRNSSSSKFLSWGANSGGTNGQMQMNRWTNQTSFSATPFAVTPTRNDRFEWFKVTWDGTNYNFFCSVDGDSWIKCGQEGTGFVGTVNQVGVGMQISHVHTYPVRTQDSASQVYAYSGTSEGYVHLYWYSDPDITP